MRWLIFLALVYLLWRLTRSYLTKTAGTQRTDQRPGDPGIDVMVQDPVCGVFFPRRDGVVLKQGGKEISFCSDECKNKYLIDNPQ